MQNQILLISVYCGELPWYFRYFVHSCRYNIEIDFLIVVDNPVNIELPPNIHCEVMTKLKISSLISRKLSLKVDISNSYKLCDFKPAYGKIFSEYIAGYRFWGHCDIDIIFGDIRTFITDTMLNNYDFINVRHDFISGYFALFRNNTYMNELFTQSKDFRRVFESSKHFCFDETNFMWDDFNEGKHFSKIESEIESMTHVVRRLSEQNQIRVFFDFLVVEGVPGNIQWIDGKLYFKNEFEFLLYHLILFKRVVTKERISFNLGRKFNITGNNIIEID